MVMMMKPSIKVIFNNEPNPKSVPVESQSEWKINLPEMWTNFSKVLHIKQVIRLEEIPVPHAKCFLTGL